MIFYIRLLIYSSNHLSYNLSTSSDRSSTGYNSPGKRQQQPNMGVAALASQGSSLSAVRRGDLRRQSQIIADESTIGLATATRKQGTIL